jgi:hypothetical protein
MAEPERCKARPQALGLEKTIAPDDIYLSGHPSSASSKLTRIRDVAQSAAEMPRRLAVTQFDANLARKQDCGLVDIRSQSRTGVELTTIEVAWVPFVSQHHYDAAILGFEFGAGDIGHACAEQVIGVACGGQRNGFCC